MSRIAKADINKALSLAAKTIVDAGGTDGRTSRAELKTKLATLPPEQKKLVDIFFKFIDARDFKAGAQVTAKDVSKAVAYAKEHMVAKYDLNNNGLSQTEISKMSLTGKLAVDLARTLKTATPSTTLSVADLAKEVKVAGKDVWYMSESDYRPEPISGKPANGTGITEANVKAAFGTGLLKFFERDMTSMSDMAFEIRTPAETKAFLDDLQAPSVDDDEIVNKSAAGFKVLRGLLEKNLTNVTVVKVGPKETDGTLASDQGLYSYLVIGKAADGQLAGMSFGAVET
jgi:hypothetical protein